jgi:hypothetical protein
MWSERCRSWLLGAGAPSAVLGLFGCGLGQEATEESAPPLELGQLQSAQHGAPVPDAPDAAFVTRASIALIGRPPLSTQEFADLLAAAGGGRGAVLDHLMGSDYADEFARHWSSVILDVFKVYRLPDTRTNGSCWNVSNVSAANQASLAKHIAMQPTSTAWSGGTFTMRDVVEGAVRADDLRAPLRANFFAQMSTPLKGNQLSEPNVRADLWTRFESSYLNRQILCLSCHNNAFSVSGSASDWDRHSPLPDLFEQGVFGSSNAAYLAPPELHADFRFCGVVASTGGDPPCPSISAPEHPWGMAAACGEFDSSPTVESTCPATPPEDIGPSDSGYQASLLDSCFPDPSDLTQRIPARARFGLELDPASAGSVFRLDQLLSNGMASMAETGLADIPAAPSSGETFRDVEATATVTDAERSFAIMVAANVAEHVWEEVYGSRLTLAHYIPRVEESRNVLHTLTQTLLKSPLGDPWSLRLLLKTALLRPEFNAATGTGEPDDDEYPLERLFNPWALNDPRPAPEASGLCSTASPTYEGCVRGLLQRHRCVNCHENPDVGPRSFSHEDVATVQARTISSASCESLKTEPSCLADIDCAAVGGKPGSSLAVRVSCTVADARMPLRLAPLPQNEIDAIVSWVAAGAPAGVRGDPPPLPAGTSQNQVDHNSVGDRISWKSPYQLTYTLGSTLGKAPFASGPFPTSSTYPTPEVAEVAGHLLLQSKPGGRGMSILSLLGWEREHSKTGEPCRVDAGNDGITALVSSGISSGATVEALVAELKQALLGESALGVGDGELGTGEAGERELLQGVLAGAALSDVVTAGNSASVESGLRQVCNVLIKSPLFLLSYLEAPPSQLSASRSLLLASAASPARRGGGASGGATSDPLDPPWPALCDDRLDCRPLLPELASALEDCWAEPARCDGRGGFELTRQVTTTLLDLRLPVEPPALTLELAREQAPALVPSLEDPRLESNLLALPFAGGTVSKVAGDVKVFYRGRFSALTRGSAIAFGAVLFVPEGAKLDVRVGAVTYETGRRGMEAPFEADEPEPQRPVPGQHSFFGWLFPPSPSPHAPFFAGHGPAGGHHFGSPWGHHPPAAPRPQRRHPPVWVICANGPQAVSAKPPSFDPRIDLGVPLTPPATPPPEVGLRPEWAAYGEGGLWYNRRQR